jgi:hypothetical protein
MRPAITIVALCVLAGYVAGATSAPASGPAAPNNAGPVKLVCASFAGGKLDDELVGVCLTSSSLVLVGNSPDLGLPPGVTAKVIGPDAPLQDAAPPADAKAAKSWKHPSLCGFVLTLDRDGRTPREVVRFGRGAAVIRKALLDTKDRLWILGQAADDLELAGVKGKGAFVALMENSAAAAALFHDGAIDFGVDSNGECVVLGGQKITRYSPDLKTPRWSASWKASGRNTPGAIAVDAKTGVTAVIGYGMTHTGREPYKAPYAYGFGRDGSALWSLWNPDPRREVAAQFGGNGLMADTTGHAAAATPDGKLLLMLFADGGNSVCTRDPADPDKPIDKSVFEGVHQKGPGFGFKGASKTSVIFRVDSAAGRVEKGTWMSAWLTPSRANGLSIDAACAAPGGERIFVAGGSASGCPTKLPWYVAGDGDYQGGGFLAVMDGDFRMIQCGYFPGASVARVAYRNGLVAIAGASSGGPTPTHNAFQGSCAGGKDGYFVLLRN